MLCNVLEVRISGLLDNVAITEYITCEEEKLLDGDRELSDKKREIAQNLCGHAVAI